MAKQTAKNDYKFQVRMPAHLMEAIKKRAEDDCLSFNSIVVQCLAREFLSKEDEE